MDAPPAHKVGEIPDATGTIREVCDRCWHNPALFFMPREIEIHGSERAALEHMWRVYLGIPDGQTTLGTVVPPEIERLQGKTDRIICGSVS